MTPAPNFNPQERTSCGACAQTQSKQQNSLAHGEAPSQPWRLTRPFVFAYFPGPRTKTPAENAYLATLPAHGNSMTLAPEVVLLAELGIPVAAVAVPHKRSVPPTMDSAQLLNAQLQALEDTPPGQAAPHMGPYVYVHARANAETQKGAGNEAQHNSSEGAMRATLDSGQDTLARLVLAWLLRETGWAPQGEDPVKWYLQEMSASLASAQADSEKEVDASR